jgi:UDP-2,4-diacetamido-2,4,6-trideoxy-beta-L-altropyranose hydrolase
LRADGNLQSGLGHFYRCIAIAEILEEEFEPVFLTQPSSITNVIPSKFKIKTLPEQLQITGEPDWIAGHLKQESDTMIIDGYQFDGSYQRNLKEKGLKVIYIDDLQKEHMYADAVINHAPTKNAGAYKKEHYTQLFLGCEYAMLRKSFLQEAKKEPVPPVLFHRAFISMGGSDEFNLTGKFIDALQDVAGIKHLDVVIGAAFSRKEQIMEKIKRSTKSVLLHSNLSETEMVALMKLADITFSPSSNTCLELISLKKIIFSGHSASNQMYLYNYFTENNLVFALGDLLKITAGEITAIVERELEKKPEIEDMLKRQQQLIDGHSDSRIRKIVSQLS